MGSKGWRGSVGKCFFGGYLGGGFKPTTDHCFRGAPLGHGRGMYAACRDWTGQAKIFQGMFLLDETAKIEYLGMGGCRGDEPAGSAGRGTQEQ